MGKEKIVRLYGRRYGTIAGPMERKQKPILLFLFTLLSQP